MENILISLIGSLIALDTTVAFQFLISQPLIACTLIGWFLGDVQLGIQIGFYLQLLWLSNMPVGAAIIPEGNVAAIVVTALVIRYSQIFTSFSTILISAITFGVFISYIGGIVIIRYRKFNTFLLQKVIVYVKRGNLHTLSAINIIALISHYVVMFGLILISLNLGDLLYSYFHVIPSEWDIFFKRTTFVVLGIGVGLVIPIFIERYSKLFIFTGFLIGIMIFFTLH